MKDSYEYLSQAQNIFTSGSWYAGDLANGINPDLFSFRLPLYAVFIGLIKTFWNSDIVIIFCQYGLSIFNFVLLYSIVSFLRIRNKKHYGTYGLVFLLMMPTQLIMAGVIMSDIFLQTLILLLFYTCIRYLYDPNTRKVSYIALLLSLLILTKPVTLFLTPVVFFWMVVFSKRFSFRFLPLLLVPAVYVMICFQQKHQTGYFHYTSMKAVNQLKFHARYTLLNLYGEEVAEKFTSDALHRINLSKTYQERNELMNSIGDSVILAHPMTFARLYIKGCFVFMMDPGRHDFSVFMGDENKDGTGLFYKSNDANEKSISTITNGIPLYQKIYMVYGLICNLLIGILILYFFLKVPFHKKIKWLLVLFILYFVMATGMLGVARYRSEIIPLLILPSIFALEYFIRNKNVRYTTTKSYN